MRCRKLYEYTDTQGNSHRNVVWYGSGGIVEENRAILTYYEENGPGSADDIHHRVTGFTKYFSDDLNGIYKYHTEENPVTHLRNDIYIDIFNKFIIYVNDEGTVFDFLLDTSQGSNGLDYLSQYIYFISPKNNTDIVDHRFILDTDDNIREHSLFLYSNRTTINNHQIALEGNPNQTYHGIVQILNTKISPKQDEGEKNINYSEKQRAVKDNLIQRMSVFKKELWYRPDYGLPLFDKIRDKGIIDAIALQIITQTPNVLNIIAYASGIVQHKYGFSFAVSTDFSNDIVDVDM